MVEVAASVWRGQMDIVQPVLVLAGRTVLGVLLAIVFSVIGIGIAWAMFVFFGAVSHGTLLVLFMIGAGLGAGLGSYIAFLRFDWAPTTPVLAAMGLTLVLAGMGGAWGGFQFGANQDVECCVGPAVSPIGYTAMGATLGAIAAALVMSIARETKVRRGWSKFHPVAANSAVGTPSETERFPQ
jgi:hypothetical protein